MNLRQPGIAVSQELLDASYESGHESRRGAWGDALRLITAQGTKGKAFDHVVLMDRTDRSLGDENERRLFYWQ